MELKVKPVFCLMLGALFLLAAFAPCDGNDDKSPEPTNTPEEHCDVVLKELGPEEIEVLKAVGRLTDLSLKEAKIIVEGAPSTVLADVSSSEAERAKRILEGTGAIIEIVGLAACHVEHNGMPPEPNNAQAGHYYVILVKSGQKRAPVVKQVRRLTGLGLRESTALVDGAPSKVLEDVSRSEAERAKRVLTEAGAIVEIRE